MHLRPLEVCSHQILHGCFRALPFPEEAACISVNKSASTGILKRKTCETLVHAWLHRRSEVAIVGLVISDIEEISETSAPCTASRYCLAEVILSRSSDVCSKAQLHRDCQSAQAPISELAQCSSHFREECTQRSRAQCFAEAIDFRVASGHTNQGERKYSNQM